MGLFVALFTILVALLLPFADKIIGVFSSRKSSGDADAEDEFDLIMSENDNSGFRSHLD